MTSCCIVKEGRREAGGDRRGIEGIGEKRGEARGSKEMGKEMRYASGIHGGGEVGHRVAYAERNDSAAEMIGSLAIARKLIKKY